MEKALVEFQDSVTHLIHTGQLTLYAISTLLSHCDQCDFKSVQEGTLKNHMMKARRALLKTMMTMIVVFVLIEALDGVDYAGN